MNVPQLEIELVRERTELQNMQADARKQSTRGLKLLASIPLVGTIGMLMALSIPGTAVAISAFIATCLYVLFAGIGGVGNLLAGSIYHRNVSTRLKALDEQRQLPEARVVVR